MATVCFRLTSLVLYTIPIPFSPSSRARDNAIALVQSQTEPFWVTHNFSILSSVGKEENFSDWTGHDAVPKF
jgi:hypothetical protein